jgi:hypothetical protein
LKFALYSWKAPSLVTVAVGIEVDARTGSTGVPVPSVPNRLTLMSPPDPPEARAIAFNSTVSSFPLRVAGKV